MKENISSKKTKLLLRIVDREEEKDKESYLFFHFQELLQGEWIDNCKGLSFFLSFASLSLLESHSFQILIVARGLTDSGWDQP